MHNLHMGGAGWHAVEQLQTRLNEWAETVNHPRNYIPNVESGGDDLMFSRQDFTRSERSLVIIQRKNCKFVSYKWEVNINCNPYLQVVYIKLCHGIKISYSRGFDSGLNLGRGGGGQEHYIRIKKGGSGGPPPKKLLSITSC